MSVVERSFPIRIAISDDSPHLIRDSCAQENQDGQGNVQSDSAVDFQQGNVVVVGPPQRQHSSDSTSRRPSLATSTPPTRRQSTVDESPAKHHQQQQQKGHSGIPGTEPPERKGSQRPRPVQSLSGFYTEKYEYSYEGSEVHGVTRGRRGEFTRCEDEPIHIPGAIQAFGMLVALKREAENWVARIVSENSYRICGHGPLDIFALQSFHDILPHQQRALFDGHATIVQQQFEDTGVTHEPRVFSVTLNDPSGLAIPTWCAMHYVPHQNNLIVCEFEPQNLTTIPLGTPPEEVGETPVNTIDSDLLDAQESLKRHSKPLQLPFNAESLADARAIGFVDLMCQIQRQFSSAKSVEHLYDIIVGTMHDLTKYGRVMVYQFDELFNGKVVSEFLDPRASTDVFRGLHFPHTDIPKQARELYKINKVRVLFDRDQPTARLVCRTLEDLNDPLDLTHSYLRAMSPVHIKYLSRISVRSTMSISLEHEGELWGLVVLHGYGPTATHVSFPIREICYWAGLCASSCLEKLIYAKKLAARRVLETIQRQAPKDYLTASTDELLHLFEADSGFLVIRGEATALGRVRPYAEAITLLKYACFRFRNAQKPFSSRRLTTDLADLKYEPGFKVIAGILFIPLSPSASDFLLFFRHEQATEIHWAGNPNMNKEIKPLEPRNSFKIWTEIVRGSCREWTMEQLEIAAMTQLVYGNFVQVWREKDKVAQESRMRQILLLNASHEVRTPLNAVINYLELAMEKPIDNATREILATSHAASKSLIFVVNDLLHLTGTKKGPLPTLSEPFDINVALHDAMKPLEQHAFRKSLHFRVSVQENIHRFVRGDIQRLQQAVTCIVANAIKHTRNGAVTIELFERSRSKIESHLSIIIRDTGPGFTEHELDDLFQDMEQVHEEELLLASDSKRTSNSSFTGTPRSEKSLKVGLGMSLVARFVRNMNGQICVRSVKGEGSTFTLDLTYPQAPEAAHPFQTPRFEEPPILQSHSWRNLPQTPFRLPAAPPPGRTILKDPRQSVTATPAVSPIPQSPMEGIEMSAPCAPFSTPTSAPASMQGSNSARKPLVRQDSKRSSKPPELDQFVLVADDNPLNVQILQRRLEKMGFKVKTSRDGQECFDVFKENPGAIDFILMDLDMPIVNGAESVALIREMEASVPSTLSAVASSYGRTPIFAISASLDCALEKKYLADGFDGWMAKPVDFKRLPLLLNGAKAKELREQGVSQKDKFQEGGWFAESIEGRRIDEPSRRSSVSSMPLDETEANAKDYESESSEPESPNSKKSERLGKKLTEKKWLRNSLLQHGVKKLGLGKRQRADSTNADPNRTT